MNKALKQEVKGLQGAMESQAEKYPLPEGFTVKSNERGNGRIITAPNGRSVNVGLYAYGDVRRVISELKLK